MTTSFDHAKLVETFDKKQPNTTSIPYNENISAKLISSKPNSGTPKRRLSYQNMNSPPITTNNNSHGKLPTPGILSNSTGDLSPFIKRKCLVREKPIKFSTFSFKNSLVGSSDSPYMVASDNLNNEMAHDSSPKNLNDSFESIQSNAGIRITSRYMSRRRLSKHKSAPLTNLTQQFNNINHQSSPISKLQYGLSTCTHQPLNDISNHINHKQLTNSLTNSIQNGFKLTEETSTPEDDVTELENLIYGNQCKESIESTNMRQITNQTLIKQSLEKDSLEKKSHWR